VHTFFSYYFLTIRHIKTFQRKVVDFTKRRQWVRIFLFTTASRPALWSTQPRIQWVTGALSVGVKWPGREADHSLPSSAEVKNAWSYTSTPPVHLHGLVLSYSTGITLPLPDITSTLCGHFRYFLQIRTMKMKEYGLGRNEIRLRT
jgi:hypothetical protein